MARTQEEHNPAGAGQQLPLSLPVPITARPSINIAASAYRRVRVRPVSRATAAGKKTQTSPRLASHIAISSNQPFHHRLQPKFSVPMVFVLGLLVVTVGPSRVYEGDHWPSDVAAAYLLAAALLMVLVPMYRRFLQTGSVLGFTLPQFLNR